MDISTIITSIIFGWAGIFLCKSHFDIKLLDFNLKNGPEILKIYDEEARRIVEERELIEKR